MYKIGKNPQNKRVLHAVIKYLIELAKGSLIAFRAIAKGYQTPFKPYSMQNPLIACKADNVCNIPLGEFNLNFKKWRKVLKFCLPSAVVIHI